MNQAMVNGTVSIVFFEDDPSSLKPLFKSLNHEWLNKYFFVTKEDDLILDYPEKIIRDGGCVLFVKMDSEIVGTCALMKEEGDEYSVAKMAVTEKAQGKKIGRVLMQAIIDEARRMGAKFISLDTAKQLEAAIALYKKFGFVQTTAEGFHSKFGRRTFRMELILEHS
ncbi:MAG: GNAT family N-acetyltransferase [Bacteroidetes bacterium]|nr:GNAT family N-acetyltransferase [Bacteroidota bacterium]